MFDLHRELTEAEDNLPLYFLEFVQLFKNINVEVKVFSEKTSGSLK